MEQKYGSMPSKSVVTNLLTNKEDRVQPSVKNIDLLATFIVHILIYIKPINKVNHELLIYKLSKCGMGNIIILFMKSYMKDKCNVPKAYKLNIRTFLSRIGNTARIPTLSTIVYDICK